MLRFLKSAALFLCASVLITNAQEYSFEENSIKKRNAAAIASGEPLYRDAVDELMGGKTPESLMNRLELNEVDAMGLDGPGAEEMIDQLKNMALEEEVQTRQLPQRGYPHTAAYHPGPYSPAPQYHAVGGYKPTPSPYLPYAAAPAYHYAGNAAHSSYHHPGPHAPAHHAGYHPAPAPGYHEPAPYHPAPAPAYHEPAPYHPAPKPTPGYAPPTPAYGHPTPEYGHPEPGYGPPKSYAPKEPVLLAKRPHEVKEIRPVEIVTHDTYTNFDCRGKKYEHIYADVEAECKIYHVCHSHGKQDTFHCPYGTLFNEYIGTCDHSGATVCHSGPGYAKPSPPPKKPGYHEPHPGYHEPAPYHPPAPAPYHAPAPAPYHAPAPHPHHAEPYHPSPAPYHPTPAYHPPTPTPYHEPAPYAATPYSPHEARAYDAPFVHF